MARRRHDQRRGFSRRGQRHRDAFAPHKRQPRRHNQARRRPRHRHPHIRQYTLERRRPFRQLGNGQPHKREPTYPRWQRTHTRRLRHANRHAHRRFDEHALRRRHRRFGDPAGNRGATRRVRERRHYRPDERRREHERRTRRQRQLRRQQRQAARSERAGRGRRVERQARDRRRHGLGHDVDRRDECRRDGRPDGDRRHHGDPGDGRRHHRAGRVHADAAAARGRLRLLPVQGRRKRGQRRQLVSALQHSGRAGFSTGFSASSQRRPRRRVHPPRHRQPRSRRLPPPAHRRCRPRHPPARRRRRSTGWKSRSTPKCRSSRAN